MATLKMDTKKDIIKALKRVYLQATKENLIYLAMILEELGYAIDKSLVDKKSN